MEQDSHGETNHVERIRQALQDKKVVIIVGAGITLSATHPSSSPLTWTGLIRNGLDYLQKVCSIPGDDDDLNHYRKALQKTDMKKLLRTCSYLKDELNEKNKFPTWLDEVFGSLHKEVKQRHIYDTIGEFHRRGARLMTTNYDELLEHFCGLQRVRRSIPDDVRKYERGIDNGVLHIHGSFQDPNEVVLDAFDYSKVKNSEDVQALLKTFLAHNTILFVGCGSGLEDPNFNALLKWASSRSENIPHHHYLLATEVENPFYDPLITLKYGPNYEDLVPYLNNLLEIEEDPSTRVEENMTANQGAREMKVAKFLRTLYTCPYRDRKERNAERVPDTCEWFTSHNLFQHWIKSPESSLLWVSADPGCGKSVLTKYLIDHVIPSTNDRTTCYFFFKDDFTDQKSAPNALCAILRQIFLSKPHLLHDSILQRLDTDGDKFIHSFHDLWSTLTNVAADKNAGEIVCILDALDECQDSDRSQFIKAVTNFYSTHSNSFRLKFLLTSRPYDHIRREFWELENRLPTIHLSGEKDAEVEKISHEIDLVIKSRVGEIGRKRWLEPNELVFLQTQLTSVPNRTYLWVSLTLDVIENMPGFTRGQVQRTTRQIPQTVDDAYERILERSPDREKAKRILHIVTAAKRPMTLREMSLVMTIEKAHRSYDDIMLEVEPELRFQDTLRNLCGLFVVIIDSKVYLLHQTAKEFLVCNDSSGLGKDTSNFNTQNNLFRWKHSLNPVVSNRVLAERCIWYLMLDFIKARLDILLDYSAKHWPAHFCEAGIQSEEETTDLAKNLCETESKRYRTWSAAYARNTYGYPKSASSLNIAAYFGLEAVARLLLEAGKVEVDSRDSEEDRTPLSWAAARGHEAVVELLLATGKVEVDSRDKTGWTPLTWAAEGGHEAVVELLLATGKVEVDSRDKTGWTPLTYAAEGGHEAVVELLLATGKVEVDSRDKTGWTPLTWAAGEGHEAVVELLLATGKVEVDSRDREGRTPLSWAAGRGHEAVVELLLATGKVEVDSRDREGRTPLSWAAGQGHEAVVELLLATGKVEVDSRDREGRTPLSWAAGQGHEAVVELLLATGKVEVDSKSNTGRTPLSWAAGQGHEAVVELLLATGKAEVDSRDREGWTPLTWAAEGGHEAVVELLLATGKAEVDSRDREGWTPLTWAAEGGHEAVVELLLATGKVEVDSKSNTGRTPLSYAAEGGHEAVVELLQTATLP